MKYAIPMVLIALLILMVPTWQPARQVAYTSPAFEQSLTDSGLRPLDERKTAALLSDTTVYATHVLTGQKWIEYYDRSGAVVRTKVPHDPAGARTDRPLLFGSWWGQGDDICFAYGLSRVAECYRLYYLDGSLLYVQTRSSSQVPAGAVLGYSTEIRSGDTENFPLIGD